MNCLVCVKQVPDTDKITMDPVRHTLVRDGASAILNPYDAGALELALRLKESTGGTVTVLSMGPPSARATLEKCLAAGADGAYLISGKNLAGADTLATGYTLSRSIRYLSRHLDITFDLILCGKQAIDGDTAQVGPMLAEFLKLPQITGIRELQSEGGGITVRRQTSLCEETLHCGLPALVTVSASRWPLRIPSLKSKLAARKKEIPILDEDTLGLDRERCGLQGSPTRVVSTAVKQSASKCIYLENAEKLTDVFSQIGVLKRG